MKQMEHERKMQQEAFQQKMEQEHIKFEQSVPSELNAAEPSLPSRVDEKTLWKEGQLIIDSYFYVNFLHLYICIIVFIIIIIIVIIIIHFNISDIRNSKVIGLVLFWHTIVTAELACGGEYALQWLLAH